MQRVGGVRDAPPIYAALAPVSSMAMKPQSGGNDELKCGGWSRRHGHAALCPSYRLDAPGALAVTQRKAAGAGWAKERSDVPIGVEAGAGMMGTRRFAHPTGLASPAPRR